MRREDYQPETTPEDSPFRRFGLGERERRGVRWQPQDGFQIKLNRLSNGFTKRLGNINEHAVNVENQDVKLKHFGFAEFG